MKKQKKVIIIILGVLILVLPFLLMLTILCFIDNTTEKNTIEFEASISEVKVNDGTEDISVWLYVNEYEGPVTINSPICENIDISEFEALQNGEKIYFRVKNFPFHDEYEDAFFDAVSLRTDNKTIYTLEQQNQYMHKTAKVARIGWVATTIVLYSVSIVLVIRHKKKHST